MISLPNNYYCPELKVLPQNRKTAKASLKDEWMDYYRFYDPTFRLLPIMLKESWCT
jgi:hypothetical protein